MKNQVFTEAQVRLTEHRWLFLKASLHCRSRLLVLMVTAVFGTAERSKTRARRLRHVALHISVSEETLTGALHGRFDLSGPSLQADRKMGNRF